MIKNVTFVFCAVVLLMTACNTTKKSMSAPEINTLTRQEENDGWKLLFDGKTKTGWHTYGKPEVAEAWKIADGVLFFDTARLNGKRAGGGDIITNDEYENFHLKLEWKIAPGGNSGVIFLVNEDPAKYKQTYATGPELQIIDNNGHADAKNIKHRAGDLYDLMASSKETVKPLDEWNMAELKINNGKLDLYLNGTNTVSTTMFDDNWKTLVSSSKFKTWEGFGKFKKGKIALQDHGNMVFFRNIKIKQL